MRTQYILQIENTSVDEFKNELLADIKQIIAKLIHEKESYDELLTRKETADLLQVSLTTLWQWTRKDIIPAYRIGNKVRYKKSEVLASIKQRNMF
jgi:excisionase family DNA binding protein